MKKKRYLSDSVSRKLPFLKFSTIKLPPGELPPGIFQPRKFSPGILPPMFLNIPTRVVFFFLLSPLSLILLKKLFRNSIFLKTDLLRCFFKKYCSLLAQIVTYSKKFCWSYMIIGHDYIHLFVLKLFILEAEECDVTQFNQLNLNSSFSHLAINSLINLLIYLQK